MEIVLNKTAKTASGATPRPIREWPGFLPAAAVVIIGLGLSFVAWTYVAKYIDQPEAQGELASLADSRQKAIQTVIDGYENLLVLLAKHFQVAHAHTGPEFRTVVGNVPFVESFEQLAFAPRVRRDDRLAHEQTMVRAGFPGYRITDWSADGKATIAGERSDYFPVVGLVGLNAPLTIGLDIGSIPSIIRLFDLYGAADWLLSSAIVQINGNGVKKDVFYLIYPVFKAGVPVDTLEERQRNLAGYIVGVVSPVIAIETAVSAFTVHRGIDLYVFPDRYAELPFYIRASVLRSTPAPWLNRSELETKLHWNGQLVIGDQHWPMIAVLSPGSPIASEHREAAVVLWSGLLLTASVGAYVFLLARQRARLQIALRNLRIVSQDYADAHRIVMNTATVLYRLGGEPSLPLIYISENVSRWGYDAARLLQFPQFYREAVHPEDAQKFREYLASLQTSSNPPPIEIRVMATNGEYRWMENKSRPVRDEAGRLIEIEGLLVDITERKAAEAEIEELARTDSLTGLANRTTFMERLQQAFVAARRGPPGFAVLYLDVDRFKTINDTLGHAVGDRFLVAVAERLKSNVREIDLAARIGGDEFAILETGLNDPSGAGVLAATLRAAIAQPVPVDQARAQATASIGIAIYDREAKSAADMLARADLALYRAKEEGRDQYRFHTPELDSEVRQQVALSDELQKALADEQLELFFQPQVELASGRIVGMEALLRWNHPIRGLMAPYDFLPIAERTGTIVPVGRWVLGRACQQMSLWRAHGVAPPRIAVNVSPMELKVPDDYERFFGETVEKWNLPYSDIEVDVTESALAYLTLANNDILGRLRKRGVNIAIDDFGMQFSTLRYLTAYSVNRIKIPHSLVEQALKNPANIGLVRAIIDVARELHIDVVAQAVESEEQWTFLSTTSPVAKVQGFYFSEPVPADRAEELLRRGYVERGRAKGAAAKPTG